MSYSFVTNQLCGFPIRITQTSEVKVPWETFDELFEDDEIISMEDDGSVIVLTSDLDELDLGPGLQWTLHTFVVGEQWSHFCNGCASESTHVVVNVEADGFTFIVESSWLPF